jgi:hypothetical protein
MCEGVRLTVQWIKQPLQVELDCKMLISGIMQEEKNGSQIAGVIAEIKGICQLLLACNFMHARRSINRVADGLLQMGVKRRGGTVMRFWASTDVQALIEKEPLGLPGGFLLVIRTLIDFMNGV